jgi:hypothetical protein
VLAESAADLLECAGRVRLLGEIARGGMGAAFGEVQLMDWGLAKRLEDGPEGGCAPTPALPAPDSSTPIPTPLTRPGAVVGSPGFMHGDMEVHIKFDCSCDSHFTTRPIR